MNTLPDKPSELLRLAVEDLKKAEETPYYQINMGNWHQLSWNWETDSSRCEICLAGAVMAFSLGTSRDRSEYPDKFPEDTRSKLLALDLFRQGGIGHALSYIKLTLPDSLPASVRVAVYSINPRLFKKDMLRIANLLEGAGL